MLFLFACLQPVQSTSEPSQAQVECVQSCELQALSCAEERECNTQCTTLVEQLNTGSCLSFAEDLWRCQQEQTWTCIDGTAQQDSSEACSAQEESYLLCFVPEDTGSSN